MERHHLDGQLFMIFRNKYLGIIRAIEILSFTILPGTSMITTNNEVSRTEIFTDDSMPNGFSWTCHTHSKGQKSQLCHSVRILRHNCFIYSNTSVVINISGFRQPNNGVDEDVRLALAGGADGQLTVSAVHGVTSLECDDLTPCELLEVRAELSGGDCQYMFSKCDIEPGVS